MDQMSRESGADLNVKQRKSFAFIKDVQKIPGLIQVQLDAFRWFQKEGLQELFDEVNPIISFNKNLELHFLGYRFEEPSESQEQCRDRDSTYAAPLWIRVEMINKETGEIQEQEVFVGDFPLMTEKGTFIINGAERVVVSQLIRSPGVYLTAEEDRATGRKLCMAKLIPDRGAWLEFETNKKNVISVKVDRKRKVPVTMLLRAALALSIEEEEERRERWRELWGRLQGVKKLKVGEKKDLVDELTRERAWWVGRYHSLGEKKLDVLRLDTEYRVDRHLQGYEHDCWADKSHPVNSEENEICPECGWYICPVDGRCQDPLLTQIGEGEAKFEYRCRRRFHGFEGTDEELLDIFSEWDDGSDQSYIEATIEKDPTEKGEEGLLEFYKRLRPGDPPTLDNATDFLRTLLFSGRRYDLGKVGRYKLNRRLGLPESFDQRMLTPEDMIRVVGRMIRINNGVTDPDDIDHLGNRRVKTVGELIQNHLRIGFLRMERVVRERMSIRDPEQLTPVSLINIKLITAAVREFFGGSQLSQFMDQTNPLAELTHKRRLSALGPGGLRRERAGFDVRDVHYSHYGRICPIETPEGPNIGLIGSLATYARINEYGFIETPYRRVTGELPNTSKDLVGKTLWETLKDPDKGKVVADGETVVTEDLAARIAKWPERMIPIVPVATDEVVYLSADDEDQYVIAQANARLDRNGQFMDRRVSVRHYEQFYAESVEKVDFIDVSPKQIVSVSAALIPFLEHDDANRALMGSNMQRQAVPLLSPEAPLVGTGMEFQAALDSGQVVAARDDGEVVSVTSDKIVIRKDAKDTVYQLRKYDRSNQSTCIDQRSIVSKGAFVRKGEVIADSSSTDNGELALGQNVLVAFMSWEGGNYEDAILVSESLVREDKFSSVHIEKHEVEARDTKLGSEEITRDIPNVGDEALRNLDEEGIIYVGAEVGPSDILVGKITPKGETDLTPEEKLLRAIFGEKAREVKDSSLRLPHGEKGRVCETKVFSRDEYQGLRAGVERMVRVSVAQRRKLTVGDKMAGRHGNKGVISQIVPIENMPFLPDGTPVEIILNPLGVPSRMNIGQILETHLGWASDRLGFRVMSPVFDGADEEEISAVLARGWLRERGTRDLTGLAWEWLEGNGYDPDQIEDDEAARKEYLLHEGEVGDDEAARLMDDKVFRSRFWLRRWLEGKGLNPDELLVFEGDDRSITERQRADRLAERVCNELWLRDMGRDTHGLSDDDLVAEARKVSKETGWPLPTSGKTILYDGKTGEPFDEPVTVGAMYIMKLAHLVEDKVHARSTGPYSLVTQQPLGGKAQFGGQRFGEMEVWALEAYGAAHTLREMLTVKSDDVTGRVRTYEAIVKGDRITGGGIPESFHVLVKELQSLGLSIDVLDEDGKVIHLGKRETDYTAMPRLGLGFGRGEFE